MLHRGDTARTNGWQGEKQRKHTGAEVDLSRFLAALDHKVAAQKELAITFFPLTVLLDESGALEGEIVRHVSLSCTLELDDSGTGERGAGSLSELRSEHSLEIAEEK